MLRNIGLVVIIAASLTLQGCIGVGAWTLGTRTESSDRPKVGQTRGSLDVHTVATEGTLKTATDLRARWGEPDRVVPREPGQEEWIYETDGLRWSGIVLYVVVVPLPAMVPVGSQYVSILIRDGHIESAARTDWSFKDAAYCGFFGMMYGGWQCETGNFKEIQGSASGS
jgi:hypothetical protein